jgi:hypothetical protein
MAHLLGGFGKGPGQSQGARSVMLQQMKRHARGRLHTDPW